MQDILRVNRIFTPQTLVPQTNIVLESSASQHLLRVLRLKLGAMVTLFNGDGHDYQAELIGEEKKCAHFSVLSRVLNTTESPLLTELGIVISKGDRMDTVVQKATELGVNVIYPLTSERCDVKLVPERAEKRRLHWQKVAIAACEQCGRAVVPTVHPIQPLEQWIKSAQADLAVILHHRSEPAAWPTSVSSACVLIGPEGGFSEAEVTAAERQSFRAWVLGPRVLRTETAPLTALSILQQRFGDFTL